MPAGDEIGRLAQRSVEDGGRLDDRVVRPAIHHDLAQDRPDPVRLGCPEGGLGSGLVHHAVGEDGGRPGRREGLEDRRRQPFGDGRVGPRALGRERQAVEPGQQVEREAEPGVGDLRQVRVQVDHPGHQDPRSDVERGRRLGPTCRRRTGIGEPAGLVDEQQAVRLVPGPARGQGSQQPAAQRERRSIGKVVTSHAREASTRHVPDRRRAASAVARRTWAAANTDVPPDRSRNRRGGSASATEGACEHVSERTPRCVSEGAERATRGCVAR